MINLLSLDIQKQHRAAHMNLKLRGYLALVLAVLVGVIAIFGGGLLLTLNERSVAKAQSASNTALATQYAPIRARADAFSSNLRTAKSILSQEVLYSDMITRIAGTLPANAVLSSLSLDQQTLLKPITLTARVVAKSEAITLKTTLENSPLFENVNINNITEDAPIEPGADAETNPITLAHPVVVTISMTISRGGPEALLR